MKILKSGITQIYDFTCEEIRVGTCPVCKAVFEYTQSDCKTETIKNEFYDEQLATYNSRLCTPYWQYGVVNLPPLKSYLLKYIACPCCSCKITIL